MNGVELLRQFREEESQDAFAELVRGYVDLVFSVAQRRLGNPALAEEAAQSVFSRLASHVPSFPSEPALLGWLHRTTVHVAIDTWRNETRRRAREEKAASMHPTNDQSNDSPLIAELDEALNDLSEQDRQTLLLRFFQGRKMRELGDFLGISEDAAKMRVNRSLERLRERLALRGIQSTAVLLSALLAEQAVTAAPTALVQTLAATRFALGAKTSWLSNVARVTNAKYASALVVALVGVTFLSVRSKWERGTSAKVPLSATGQANSASATAGETAKASDDPQALPDPRNLLAGVLRARNRISSCKMEFETIVELDESSVHVRAETNAVRGTLLRWMATKQLCDQVGFEYSYVGVGAAGERFRPNHERNKNCRAPRRYGPVFSSRFEARTRQRLRWRGCASIPAKTAVNRKPCALWSPAVNSANF
jgi:RNA polymerase sigma factor (sigma-70 family)